jgi:hypothetical protein
MTTSKFSFTWILLAIASAAPAEVTYHKDVLPILQKHCQGCHRPGEAAPMPLLTYKDTRPMAAAIRQAVLLRKMPPWHADPSHGQFVNERRLTQAEIDVLAGWASTGAKEGDPKNAPAPVSFADGWTIGKPDVVLDMGAEHRIPKEGTIDYTYYVVATGFTEDKWVEKLEARPGARSAVHHIVVFARPPGGAYMKDAKPGVPFVPYKSDRPRNRKPDTGEGILEGLVGGAEMVATYVPGGDAYVTRDGQARLIKAGTDLVFQMHYTTNGKEAVDRSQIGMVFAKQAPRERVVNAFISNRNLVLPPGAADHKVEAKVIVQEDVALQSFFPHMHARGKAMEYRATFPNGETRVLLSVPKYDFNWQMTYLLAEPVKLPKGTKLEVSAWYDNSPNNRYNPDPSASVFWGDQTWEEMLAGFVDLVIPVSVSPERIVKPPAATSTSSAGGE